MSRPVPTERNKRGPAPDEPDPLTEAVHVLAGQGSGAHAADDARNFGRLRRWLGSDTEVLNDEILVRYLAAHPHWSAATVKSVAGAIDRHHRRLHNTRIIGSLTSAYISRQKMKLGGRRLNPVPALGLSTAIAISQELDRALPKKSAADIEAMRYGLMLLRAHADPRASIAAAWDTLSDLHLHPVGHQYELRLQQAPLATIAPEELPAAQHRLHVLTGAQRRQRAASAMSRAGVNPRTPAGQFRDDEWEWLWLMLDPGMPKLIRDRAYLLLGLGSGRRHAELKRITIDDIQVLQGHYLITYRDRKNRASLTFAIHHIDSGGTGCPAHCPACALSDALRLYHSQGRTSGPLLATRYDGQFRQMSRQNGRLIVQSLTALVGDPWGSTRSMRAGAATIAWEQGWTLLQISRLLGHADPSITTLYIRRHERPAGTLQLNLDDDF